MLKNPKKTCTTVVRGNSHLGKAINHYARFLMSSDNHTETKDLQLLTETFLRLIATGCTLPSHDAESGRLQIGKQQLHQIKQFIRHNFQNSFLSPTTVAGQFNISVNYIHKLFAQEKVTFGEYVRRLRLVHAGELLRDPNEGRKSIIEIAYEVGFNDLSHFYRLFKQQHGMAPGAYRSGSR